MPLPDVDSFDTFGGAKVDYTDIVDVTTDRSAVEINTALADVSCMTRMSPRAWAKFIPSNLTLVSHEALWGNSSNLAPVIARPLTGQLTLTWPVAVTDPLGGTHTLNFRAAWTQVHGNSPFLLHQCSVTAPNQITVYTADLTGSLANFATTISVFAL